MSYYLFVFFNYQDKLNFWFKSLSKYFLIEFKNRTSEYIYSDPISIKNMIQIKIFLTETFAQKYPHRTGKTITPKPAHFTPKNFLTSTCFFHFLSKSSKPHRKKGWSNLQFIHRFLCIKMRGIMYYNKRRPPFPTKKPYVFLTQPTPS